MRPSPAMLSSSTTPIMPARIMRPTSPSSRRCSWVEGLLIPPLKILRRGELNSDVEALICANTRTPEVTWGDVKAQVNTNTYGLSKFAELFGRYGANTVLACWQGWMDICGAELR